MNRRELLRVGMTVASCYVIRNKGTHSERVNARYPTGSLLMRATTVAGSPLRMSVRNHEAVGDGVTLNTARVQEALVRCNILGRAEFVIPAGRYLTGSLSLRSNATLRLETDATILGSHDLAHYCGGQVRREGKWISGYLGPIHAVDERNIAIVGDGPIEGNVGVGGKPTKDKPLRRPALIEPIGCYDVRLEGFSTFYAHIWSIHPTYCENVAIRNLTVRSTETNGDGIDIDSCRHVLIDDCDIATGDDCVSCKSGRGEEAYRLNRPTENVRIVNCTFEGRGYSRIGIGSEASAGIRGFFIEHYRVKSGHKNACYIKSRIGRGSFIGNLTFRYIDAANMRMGFLQIDQVNAGTEDECTAPGLEGVRLFHNFRFTNIRVHDAPVSIQATKLYELKSWMVYGLRISPAPASRAFRSQTRRTSRSKVFLSRATLVHCRR